MKFLLAAGGTAGHINPALATASELKSRFPDCEIAFLGTDQGLEARLVPEAGYRLITIARTPMPRSINFSLVTFPVRFLATLTATKRIVSDFDCVIGFGGYVAAPAYVAARLSKRPLVVHEQNAKPGFANRLGARLTRFVGVSFANTRLPHARLVGLPLSSRISAAINSTNRAGALAHFGLQPDRPTLLVTGGSQGSQRINMALAGALEELLSSGWQVLHAVGEKNQLPSPRNHYHPLAFISEMDQALLAADLLLGRSGAVTCAEANAMKVPAIYVPLPIGNGEQALNAVDAVAVGGAILVPDAELTSEKLISLIANVQPRLSEMRAALQSVGSLSAAPLLVDLVKQAL